MSLSPSLSRAITLRIAARTAYLAIARELAEVRQLNARAELAIHDLSCAEQAALARWNELPLDTPINLAPTGATLGN